MDLVTPRADDRPTVEPVRGQQSPARFEAAKDPVAEHVQAAAVGVVADLAEHDEIEPSAGPPEPVPHRRPARRCRCRPARSASGHTPRWSALRPTPRAGAHAERGERSAPPPAHPRLEASPIPASGCAARRQVEPPLFVRRAGEAPRIGVVLVAALEIADRDLLHVSSSSGAVASRAINRGGTTGRPSGLGSSWLRKQWAAQDLGCPGERIHRNTADHPAGRAPPRVDRGPRPTRRTRGTEHRNGRQRPPPPARRPRGPGGRRVATWRRGTILRARPIDQPARLRHRRHDSRGDPEPNDLDIAIDAELAHHGGPLDGPSLDEARVVATGTGPHAASPSVTAINRIVRPWRTNKRRRAPAPKISSSGMRGDDDDGVGDDRRTVGHVVQPSSPATTDPHPRLVIVLAAMSLSSSASVRRRMTSSSLSLFTAALVPTHAGSRPSIPPNLAEKRGTDAVRR